MDVDGGGIDLETPEPAADPETVTEAVGTFEPSESPRKKTIVHDWRWVVGGIGRALIVLGALVLGFVVYQLWGTGIQEARAQNKLENQFNAIIATTPAPTTTRALTTTAASATTAAATTAPTTTIPPPAFAAKAKEGDPIARIQIPKIGVDKIVVAGVGLSDLRKGPGHYPNTPLPGQVGNAAIAGHRTTYGAPFFRVDELAPGDPIVVTTVAGTFRYVVTQIKVVSPTDFSVLDPTRDATLTLTSCNPRYSSRQRIVVKAKLDTSQSSTPQPAPATTALAAPTTGAGGDSGETVGPADDAAPVDQSANSATVANIDSFSAGWFSDSGAWFPTILWGALAGLIVAGFWFLGRRWKRWAAYLFAVIPFLFVLYFVYENVARLLPPNI